MKNNKNKKKKKNNNKNNNKIALEVKKVSKMFKVPHRKIDSMRGAFVNFFKKNYYEEFKALDNISFKAKKGEFLGIIGHNGAGKSTLLKILASVYQPTSGKVKVNGRISPFLELGIGFNPELSGRDNVYLNATVLGLTKKQIDKKFDEIVEFAELEKFIDQQLKNYSSGMRARLAFSVSIYADRDILIMDEVLAVGDSAFQEKCLDIFKNYKKDGRTVILVTHSMTTVREYCDRALLFDKGKMLKSGDVDEVCDEYILNAMTKAERKELKKREKLESGEKTHKERLNKDWKQKRFEKYGNKIMKVALLNKKGEKISRITRGKVFVVHITVDVENPNSRDTIAVQIIDKHSGCIICGNNTLIDNFIHKWKVGVNNIKLIFPNNFFNKGDVYLRVMLKRKRERENETIDEYDGVKENEYIKINPKDSRVGTVYAEHSWAHKYD